MNNFSNIFNNIFSILNNNNELIYEYDNTIDEEDISSNEIDIDNILNEASDESFDLINDFLQEKIESEELYIRSYYFDDELADNDFIYKKIIKNIISIGLSNGYNIKLLSANLFAFICIKNIEISKDVINEIIKSTYNLYIRRSIYRRNIFMNLINQFLDPFDQNFEQSDKLSQQEFDKLKCFKFKNESNEKCSICNDEYEKDDELVELPCSIKNQDLKNNHYFHKDCINEWTIKHKASCPLCRTNIK
jgi:hypothetical protein